MNATQSHSIINHCHQSLKNLDNGNISDMNLLIDQLNTLDHQVTIDLEVGQDILSLLVNLLPVNNDHMLSKYCHVLQLFITKLKLTLDQNLLITLTEHLILTTEHCSTWALPIVLQSLSVLFYGNADKLTNFYHQLLSTNGILLDKVSAESEEIQLATIKCLKNITFRNQVEINLDNHYVENIFDGCLLCLKSNVTQTENHIRCKILLTALKCLQHVFAFKVLPMDNLGELLGLLRVLSYCGFPGKGNIALSCLYPTLINIPLPQESKSKQDCNQAKVHFLRQKVNKIRPRGSNTKKKSKGKEAKTSSISGTEGNCDNSSQKTTSSYSPVHSDQESSDHGHWWQTSSSDSEFSDIEDRSSTHLKSLQVSIRQHAYTTLQAVVKIVEKKAMFGYWSSFLPDSPSTPGANNLTLLTTILKDPSPQVRIAAISVLTQLMRNGKQFFSLVDDRTPSHTSFITASSAVTLMVKELHRSLLLALISENLPLVLIQVLKCYATLADVVPYNRLESEILLKVLKSLKPLISHKDCQVQVAVLTVYGALLNSDQISNEVLELIIGSKIISNTENVTYKVNSGNSLPWIIDICRERFSNDKLLPSLIIQVEALQVLRIVSGKYFATIRPYIQLMETIIIHALKDQQSSLQLHGAKLLEVIGRGILNDVNTHFAAEETFDPESDVGIIFKFWTQILGSSFTSCLSNNEQLSLQSVCCDCLSTIPSLIFAQLPRRLQVFCITIILGLSVEDNHNIRGASVRCLGVYCLFPSLREDLSFLSDVVRILVESVKDENDIVRTKVSWALGNLSDALLLSRNEFPNFAMEVTACFFCNIGAACIHASDDQDRVKVHAVRALGNMLNYIPQNLLSSKEIQSFICKAESSLLKSLSAKFMKVRWNACYAFGSALKNQVLIQSGILHLDEILKKLITMLSSSNSKVQINAALALSTLPSRCSYGELLVPICDHFILTLRTAKSSMDFKELKYFENLADTLCNSLCHLLCIANIEDFDAIYKNNVEAKESLLTSFWKFGERSTLDKMNNLLRAYEQIQHLVDTSSPSILQSLEFWRDILNEAQMAYHQD